MNRRVWWACMTATVLLAGWGVWHLRSTGGITAGPPPLPAPVLTAAATTPPPSEIPAVPGLGRVAPYKIRIPRIGLQAMVDQVGLRRDGRMETPPYERAERAAWFRDGPAPGETGAAVIVGHVDNKQRVAVFFYLSRLRPGDRITIVRADRSEVAFQITAVEQIPKAAFPTARVYGPTHRPALRLVTCGGRYDKTRQSYLDNLIVYADLVT